MEHGPFIVGCMRHERADRYRDECGDYRLSPEDAKRYRTRLEALQFCDSADVNDRCQDYETRYYHGVHLFAISLRTARYRYRRRGRRRHPAGEA